MEIEIGRFGIQDCDRRPGVFTTGYVILSQYTSSSEEHHQGFPLNCFLRSTSKNEMTLFFDTQFTEVKRFRINNTADFNMYELMTKA